MKICSKCGIKKPLNKFHWQYSKQKRHYPRGECKACSWKYQKEQLNKKGRYYKMSLNTKRQFKHTPKGIFSSIYSGEVATSKRLGLPPPTYSRKDLYNKFVLNPIFVVLFHAWSQSGYKKELKPSIDRRDYTKGYTWDNIQLMTWKENNEKGIQEMVRVVPVIIKNKNGKVLAKFKSVTDFKRQIRKSKGVIIV
jgi:hypothetical protein